jgi:hypothetical protein
MPDVAIFPDIVFPPGIAHQIVGGAAYIQPQVLRAVKSAVTGWNRVARMLHGQPACYQGEFVYKTHPAFLAAIFWASRRRVAREEGTAAEIVSGTA